MEFNGKKNRVKRKGAEENQVSITGMEQVVQSGESKKINQKVQSNSSQTKATIHVDKYIHPGLFPQRLQNIKLKKVVHVVLEYTQITSYQYFFH